jgi:hypothetical protein
METKINAHPTLIRLLSERTRQEEAVLYTVFHFTEIQLISIYYEQISVEQTQNSK